MQYTRLGTTGATVSRVCLGMMTYGDKASREWALDEDEARPLVKKAVDLGFNFFDTADVYSTGVSEVITGKLLKEVGPPRDELFLATKVHGVMGEGPNMKGQSRKHIMQAIDASLMRLGMDYVDLYQIHRYDPDTPIEETLDALNDVVRAGKALYIGASSMFAWQFYKMLATQRANGYARFVTMQNHYNLIYREEEREMIPLCREEGIGLIPWSPLGRGLLTRPRAEANATIRSQTDAFGKQLYGEDDMIVVDKVDEIARKRGVPNAQVALAWVLQQPGITAPIIGANKVKHLEDAAAALDLALDAEELKALAEPYKPHTVRGHQ